MTKRLHLCLALILMAALALLAACANAGNQTQTQPPASGLGAPLAVSQPSGEGYEGDIVFGSYRVNAIQPEKVNQADWRFVGRRGLTMTQAFSFALSGGDQDWHCVCALGGDKTGMPLNVGTLMGYGFALDPTHSKALACILRPAGKGRTWHMSLYAPPSKWKDQGLLADPKVQGGLSDGASQTIRVRAKGVVAVETVGAQMPSEYHFLGDNGEVAQVRVAPPLQVWLDTGNLRDPLAAAVGALLAVHRRRP
ncbi:MAG: hypothetical protein K9K33_16005 [Desulfarculaceae bacterium]|nr:hypothetical protein [Desulfarculaceae bacterium]